MDEVTTLAFFFLSYCGIVHGGITSLCSQTPYPKLCNSLIPILPDKETIADTDIFSFRNTALRVTLAQAQNAHKEILSMNISSLSEKGKLVWADCSELSEDTLYHLNRSITYSNPNDAQTWLSAAMANHQTCLNGFHDFELSSYLEKFPFVVGDFSKYLCNSLSINKAMTTLSTKHQLKGRRLSQVFPEWLSVSDRRKLLQTSKGAHIVVAQDGSGNYKTISEALAAAKIMRKGMERFVIYVKRGVYKENVKIKTTMKNLMFIGDGIDATIITGKRNVHDGSTTFRSATFAVSGAGFIAKGITFENTAGPQKHQAVALLSGSDFSVFYRCSFKGYQDTLYVHSHRQFYRDCDIHGTVDFIFGDAVAVLQNCNIFVRKPMRNQKNTITAQGRSSPDENTGIIIHSSRITAASDLRHVQGSFKTYLGRPWKQYSRTLFIKCTIDNLIDPVGWLPWSGEFALKTLYYGEYMNTGAGAGTRNRVTWPGYHVITNVMEAGKFSVGNFLTGDSWLPVTKVPYTSSL
ncbi:pectinesterase-like [Lycium barbarum]|uniref:pectinesterase-like n=1 Tax=Lycium barbarum TaxID=112863 RepID=UPI00293E0357|nr:pectinesterase-like [Lycium barbarum]